MSLVLIIDFFPGYIVSRHYRSVKSSRFVEYSYKAVNLSSVNNTRIVSGIYQANNGMHPDTPWMTCDDIYEPLTGYYDVFDNGEFFRKFDIIITRGYWNKLFISQFCDKTTIIYDIFNDKLPDFHRRNTRLTPMEMYNWQDPSRCPRSKCRNNHGGECTFKNVKCIINWLNDPIF